MLQRSLLILLVLASLPLAGQPADPDRQGHWTEPMTGMEFAYVPGGCFQMGSDQQLPPRDYAFFGRVGVNIVVADDEGPAHEVCVEPFWMGVYEVTRQQWGTIMGGTVNDQSEMAASGISWMQAQKFVEDLSARSDNEQIIRLPTEREWEYVCRKGQASEKDNGGLDAGEYAWYGKHQPQAVGQLKATEPGLYDMLGSQWEWVSDSYRPYAYAEYPANKMKVNSLQKVMRGGSYRTRADQLGCTRRGHSPRGEVLNTFGLRLVRIER